MRIKKILLLNPLQVNLDDFSYEVAVRKGYPAYPPMGLGYLASGLEGKGRYEVLLHDNYFEGLKKTIENSSNNRNLFFDVFEDYLSQNLDIDVVGISLMFSPAMYNFKRYVEMIKRFLPKSIIIAGGTHVTCAPQSVIEISGVDYLLRYEAEKSIPELLDRLENGQGIEGISGLVYKKDGKVVITERTFREENLDDIPSPDWKKMHMAEYYKIGRFGGAYTLEGCYNKSFACVITSRGCRGHCAFCAVSDIMGGGVRTRSVQNVIDEIGYLYNELGINFFEILDDDFTSNKKRTIAILNEIVRRNYKITWSAKNGLIACSLDEELIDAMHRSGCRYVQIGVESGNDKILKWLRKPLSIPRLLEVREIFKKFPEIYLAGYFIVGFPEETYEMMKDTYDLALKLKLDWSAITMAQPLPGTRMFNDFISIDLIDEKSINWADLTFFHNTTGNKYHSLKEILDWWHEFNIGINFINNPNLNGGNLDRAIRDFEHVGRVVAPGQQPMALYCLGKAHFKKGEKQKAAEAWRDANEILSRDVNWQGQFKKFNVNLVKELLITEAISGK